MNYKQDSYEKTKMYKKVPLHFSMVTSTFQNFPRENLESTREKPSPVRGYRPLEIASRLQGFGPGDLLRFLGTNNANRIIWVKIERELWEDSRVS